MLACCVLHCNCPQPPSACDRLLQGQYAFVIYDNNRKQAFAARDPSGAEKLYYHVSDDGAVSFASSPMSIPEAERAEEWKELPPGHYISGKHPKIHQFALTPEQLYEREMLEDCSLSSNEDVTVSMHSCRYSGAEDNRIGRHKSQDVDMFPLEL